MKKKNYLSVAVILLCVFGTPEFSSGQSIDSIIHTVSVVEITGQLSRPVNQFVSTMDRRGLDSLSRFGVFTLTDALAKVPGVTMLSTGNGIAKPVIRGGFGNRVLVIWNGMKFDNQQWQEEHGLGLTDMGIREIEVIKGPAGVQYGSEAISGVIRLMEEGRPTDEKLHADATAAVNSNTLGGHLEAGVAKSLAKWWCRVRLGMDNHADYSDGKNQRVLNSRFDGYYAKAAIGYSGKKWNSVNNFSYSKNNFGFIFNDVYTYIVADDRWNRQIGKFPAHYVTLGNFSSENTWYRSQKSKWTFNAGVQYNNRKENEGGGAISLNMVLLNAQLTIGYEHEFANGNKLSVADFIMTASNDNQGSRRIVPNAAMQENNFSVLYDHHLSKTLLWQSGAGGGGKLITTYETATVNDAEKEVSPFKKSSPYGNLFTGISWTPVAKINLKANAATGVRVPNLAELSSDGLHEGIFVYEIGNPDLKNEKVISGNLEFNYTGKTLMFKLSPFINLYTDYVYLAIVDEEWYGFPVNRYKQQDVTQWGAELELDYRLMRNLSLDFSCSGMDSRRSDGRYTPYVPAVRYKPAVRYTLQKNQQATAWSLFVELEGCLKQTKVSENEIATPAYQLLNAGLNVKLKSPISVSLAVNNILNEAYYDHLSRFKNFGLLNMGTNAILKIQYNL